MSSFHAVVIVVCTPLVNNRDRLHSIEVKCRRWPPVAPQFMPIAGGVELNDQCATIYFDQIQSSKAGSGL
jgi:hypothetical protein